MAVIEYVDGPTDLRREMLVKQLATIFSKEGRQVSVKDLTANGHANLPSTLVRNLRKVQFSNSVADLDQAVKKEMSARSASV